MTTPIGALRAASAFRQFRPSPHHLRHLRPYHSLLHRVCAPFRFALNGGRSVAHHRDRLRDGDRHDLRHRLRRDRPFRRISRELRRHDRGDALRARRSDLCCASDRARDGRPHRRGLRPARHQDPNSVLPGHARHAVDLLRPGADGHRHEASPHSRRHLFGSVLERLVPRRAGADLVDDRL